MAKPIATAERFGCFVLVARSVRTWKDAVRWRVDPVLHECKYVTLLARLDEGNRAFLDFHVLPSVDRIKRFDLRIQDDWLNCGQPLGDLREFCQLCLGQLAKNLCYTH